MSGKAKPAQFRLPEWAHEFVAEEAAQYGMTKTEVVLRALTCLKEHETERLMAEGYRAQTAETAEFAEDAVRIAEEAWPEW